MKPGRRGFDSCPYHHADVIGIGRHARLRPVWASARGGSTPPVRISQGEAGLLGVDAPLAPGICSRVRIPGLPSLDPHPSVAQRTRALGFDPRSCAGSNPAGGSRGEARAPASPAGCNPVASGFGGSTPSLPTPGTLAGRAWGSAALIRPRQVGSNPSLAIQRCSSRGRSSTAEPPVVVRAVPVQIRPATLLTKSTPIPVV